MKKIKTQSTGSVLHVIDSLEDWEYPETRLRQLNRIIDGLDAWDYQWLFNRISNSGISVVPTKNLISNIGFGPDATHTMDESEFGNRERFEIEFPMVSPLYMVRDRKRDQEYLRRAFAHHRAPLIKKVISRIRNRLAKK